jgi:hypothetical protein
LRTNRGSARAAVAIGSSVYARMKILERTVQVSVEGLPRTSRVSAGLEVHSLIARIRMFTLRLWPVLGPGTQGQALGHLRCTGRTVAPLVSWTPTLEELLIAV